MARRFLRFFVGVAALTATLLLPASLFASPIVIDFEGLADSSSVGATYPGVTFSHATVLTAGISLNEFEFPPFSGQNVAFDDGGPMRIDFSSPVSSFGGHFTYLAPLELDAFDLSHSLLGSTSSAFSSNLALSGDPGSLPNELLSLSFPGISYVTLAGDPAGTSFVVDDVTFDAPTPPPPTVPEPTSLALMLVGGGLLTRIRTRRRQRAGVDTLQS